MPTASIPSGICNPPRCVPVGQGSTSTMLHTLASVGSVSDLPLGRVYAPLDRLHAPDTIIPLCVPWVLVAGLVWLSFLDGLEVSLLSAFVHCQS